MPMTTTWRNLVGDHLVGNTDIGALADTWLALFISNPTDTGVAGTEVTGTGYARINITPLVGAFADSGLGYSEAVNASEINFGIPGGDWGGGSPITHVGIMTASSGGVMKYYEESPDPRTALSGTRAVRIRPGALKIRHY